MSLVFKSVAIGSDHAGYRLKQEMIVYLEKKGIPVKDAGTNSEGSVDYPDFAVRVAKGVSAAEVDCGIVICGSGIGVSMTANKINGIRAALCWNEELGKLAREHNNANVLALGARFIDFEQAVKIVDVFMSTEFEGGRHEGRVDKIHDLTNC